MDDHNWNKRCMAVKRRGPQGRSGVLLFALTAAATIVAGGLIVAGVPFGPPLLAQSGGPGPEFEVASIRPSGPQDRIYGMLTYPGGRMVISNFTLLDLLEAAYGSALTEISGAPKWAAADRYTIVAEPPPDSSSSKITPINPKLPPPPEEVLMLQSLLARRFHLVVHKEAAVRAGFALQLQRRSGKLAQAANKDEFPVVALGRTGSPDTPWFVQGFNASMSQLATTLSHMLKCPVVDETGLAGRYDFRFDYADDPQSTGPPIATAIKDIGLVLTPQKEIPITRVLIDSAEKPTVN